MVKKLLTRLWQIDHIIGRRLARSKRLRMPNGAYFHEPGKYIDPANSRGRFPQNFKDLEEGTGKPLGIMGMVEVIS